MAPTSDDAAADNGRGEASVAPVPRRLSRAVAAAAAGGLAGVTVTAAAIPTQSRPAFAAAAGALWVGFAAMVWRRRSWNVPLAGATPIADALSAATWVTLARALGLCVLGGFLIAPPPDAASWLPGAIYTAVALGDVVDGALARRRRRTTKLGAALDVTTDVVGLMVAPLLAVLHGRLPPWYLLLSIAYPLFQVGLHLRARLGLPIHTDRRRPYPAARAWAAAQMALVAAALFPVLPRAVLWPAATAIMLPTLALFAREWRLVTAPSAPGGKTPAEIQHDRRRVGPGAQR